MSAVAFAVLAALCAARASGASAAERSPTSAGAQAPSFLQAQMRSVPENFFEDAAARPQALVQQRGAEVSLPFDVGVGAVPLPNQFESPNPWRPTKEALSLFAASGLQREAPPAKPQASASRQPPPPQPQAQPQPQPQPRPQPPALAQQQGPRTFSDEDAPAPVAPARVAHAERRARLLQEQQALEQEFAQLDAQEEKTKPAQAPAPRVQQQAALPTEPAPANVQESLAPSSPQGAPASLSQAQAQGGTTGQEADNLADMEDAVYKGRQATQASAAASAAPGATGSVELTPEGQRLAALQRSLQEAKRRNRAVELEGVALRKHQEAARYRVMVQEQLQELRRKQADLAALEQGVAYESPSWSPSDAAAAADTPAGYADGRQAYTPQAARSWAMPAAFSEEALRATPTPAASAEYGPDHAQCSPQCHYQCTDPACEEECSPQCESPKCQTRCDEPDLSACGMQCGQPQCSVVCPQRPCSGSQCPQCTTHCSQPMCMLKCPKAQSCRNVCEEPKCDWRCQAPSSCPRPTCSMTCEAPSGCTGSTHRSLPPLALGEVAVESFAAPQVATAADPALLRGGAGEGAAPARLPQTLPVTVMRQAASRDPALLQGQSWEVYPQPQRLTEQLPVMASMPQPWMASTAA